MISFMHRSYLVSYCMLIDNTTLNSTLDCHGTITDEIQTSVVNELR